MFKKYLKRTLIFSLAYECFHSKNVSSLNLEAHFFLVLFFTKLNCFYDVFLFMNISLCFNLIIIGGAWF